MRPDEGHPSPTTDLGAPTRRQRAAQFARQHGALAALLAIVAFTLVAATVVSSLYALNAKRARDAEARARADAEHVMRLHQRMFTAARSGLALGREVTVREVLDDALFDAERELASDPKSLVEVLATIGSTYTDIGRPADAERVLVRALALASEHSTPARMRDIESSLGYAMLVRGRFVDADRLLRAAIEQTGDSPADRRLRAWSLYRRAELLRSTHREGEADPAFADALALCTNDVDPSGELRARILGAQGDAAHRHGDFASAEALHRRALEIDEKILPADHPTLAGARSGLAGDLFALGRIDEARDLWEQTLSTFERVLDPDHADIANVVLDLAFVYQRRAEFEHAEPMFARALEMRRKAFGPDHARVVELLADESNMLFAKGDLGRAEELAVEALDTRKRALEREHAGLEDPDLAGDLFWLAVVQRERHRLDEAEINLRTALRIQRAKLAAQDIAAAQTTAWLGAVLLDRGTAAEAEPLLREAAQVLKTSKLDDARIANTQSVLGGCLAELKRFDEAEPLLAESLPRIEKALGGADPRTRGARERLAKLYEQTGRAAEAEKLRVQ